MNEQLLALWNRLRRKIDLIVIFALAILLVIVFLLYVVEQENPEAAIPPLGPAKVDPTPTDWTTFTQVLFNHQKELAKVEAYAALPDFNMFDPRSALDQSELIASLDRRFETEARPAFDQGDLDTAEKVCKEIIARMPSHRKAIALRQTIRDRRQAMEEEGTTP